MFSAALRNITIRSGLVCDRIGGVKLKLYSGSAEGRTFQPLTRSQKNGSPGLMVVAEGNREMAFCEPEYVGEVNVVGWMDVVCDKVDGRSWPYFVDGQSLSSKMVPSRTLSPDMPMETSCWSSKRCFGSWRSSRYA